MDTATRPRDRSARPAPTAQIFQGELDYISRCILDCPSIETGGELFGYWTAAGVPVVLYAIGPGPNANHQTAFFNQDLNYLVAVGKRLVSRFGLQHIGEWHSHHGLGLSHPSGHDAETVADSVASQGLVRFLLAIGTCSEGRSAIRPYSFHEDFGTDYAPAYWDVKEGESPFRAFADSDEVLSRILVHPATATPNAEPPAPPPGRSAPFKEGHWLANHGGHKALKGMIDFLVTGEENRAPEMSINDDGEVEIVIGHPDGDERIVFPADFPASPPEIFLPDGAASTSTETTVAEATATGDATTTVEDALPSEDAVEAHGHDAPATEDPPTPPAAQPNPIEAAPEWQNTGDLLFDFTEYYNQNYLLHLNDKD